GEKGDYLNSFIEEYNNLTVAEVQRVMEENLEPDKMLTVVVGKSEKLETVFKEAGFEVESR
ncbi:MAG: insulinase family protein, partial [Halanaerobiaceae bacterium]